MNLALGIRKGNFSHDYLSFAAQVGVRHLIIFRPGEETLPSTRDGYWSYEDLHEMKKKAAEYGLQIGGIENFVLKNWYHIVTDGPKKMEQLDNVKKTISNMGKADIPIMGYNFSIAGVWGRIDGPNARGGALSPRFAKEVSPDPDEPIPNGVFMNFVVDENAPKGFRPPVSQEEMWERYTWFLKEIIPVAEEAGVSMAAHPEDPPIPVLRRIGRMLTHPDYYDRVFDTVKSKYNKIEFCQGTFAEMPGVDVYDTIEKFASQDKIGYVHFRNVKGKFPDYREVFVDEGDVDMVKALKLYKKHNFNGLFMPDHTPAFTAAPTSPYPGMAHAIGYMKGLMQSLDCLSD